MNHVQCESLLQIYTQGCISRVQQFVEQNLYVVAGIAMGVALLQLLGEWAKVDFT